MELIDNKNDYVKCCNINCDKMIEVTNRIFRTEDLFCDICMNDFILDLEQEE